MKFVVEFKRREGTPGYAVYVDQAKLGLDMLDRAREETDVPLLAPDKVSGVVDAAVAWSKKIEITEEEARKSGLFRKTHEVVVQVPVESLNRYMGIVPRVHRDLGTGAVIKITWDWEFDSQKILADWASCGYPVEWDPTEIE